MARPEYENLIEMTYGDTKIRVWFWRSVEGPRPQEHLDALIEVCVRLTPVDVRITNDPLALAIWIADHLNDRLIAVNAIQVSLNTEIGSSIYYPNWP